MGCLKICGHPVGAYVYDQLIEALMLQEKVVSHHSHMMTFLVPNRLCRYRADTFSTKEPDTLEWIDLIPEGSVLWDVGANVGIYSVYAAKVRNCQVYSFEPSVFNLELLARNIFVNDLQDRITIFPIALNDSLGANLFKLSSTSWGGALSSFAHDVDDSGGKMNGIFDYRTIGMTMNDAVNLLNVPRPHYIKIDVDGIEHLVLAGGVSILREVNSVLIELPGVWKEQTEMAERYLLDAGLRLVRGHKYDPVLNPYVSANQIWSR